MHSLENICLKRSYTALPAKSVRDWIRYSYNSPIEHCEMNRDGQRDNCMTRYFINDLKKSKSSHSKYIQISNSSNLGKHAVVSFPWIAAQYWNFQFYAITVKLCKFFAISCLILPVDSWTLASLGSVLDSSLLFKCYLCRLFFSRKQLNLKYGSDTVFWNRSSIRRSFSTKFYILIGS